MFWSFGEETLRIPGLMQQTCPLTCCHWTVSCGSRKERMINSHLDHSHRTHPQGSVQPTTTERKAPPLPADVHVNFSLIPFEMCCELHILHTVYTLIIQNIIWQLKRVPVCHKTVEVSDIQIVESVLKASKLKGPTVL